MRSAHLLVDFGASRVKSVLWSADGDACLGQSETAAPAPVYGPNGEVEVAPDAYWAALEATAGQLLDHPAEVASLWLCTEMHGLLVADRHGEPITPYISWRDGRGQVKDRSGRSTLERLSAAADTVFAGSGMRLRAGLPIVSLAHLATQGLLPADCRLMTLADWLVWRGGERDPAIHASLAAGTGLYDIKRHAWSAELCSVAGVPLESAQLPRVVPAGQPLGRIRLAGKELPVYGGIGDLQAAVHGAHFPERARLAVNLGTGSQVLRAGDQLPAALERRPSLSGTDIAALTHIPSGRALNVFAGFIDECALLGGGRPVFWELFAGLGAEQVLQAPLAVDLNVFDAAWRFTDGGAIRHIQEGGFSPPQLVAAIAKGWLSQYAQAMEQLDPEGEEDRFVVLGGLSRRAPWVPGVLATLCGRTALASVPETGEETLDGLLRLMRTHVHGH